MWDVVAKVTVEEEEGEEEEGEAAGAKEGDEEPVGAWPVMC